MQKFSTGIFITLILFFLYLNSFAQLQKLDIENLRVKKLIGSTELVVDYPLVSYEVNGKTFSSGEVSPLQITFSAVDFTSGVKGEILFLNNSKDTLHYVA